MTQIDDEMRRREELIGIGVEPEFLAEVISLLVSIDKLEYLIASELLQETLVPARNIREVALLNGTKITNVEAQPEAASRLFSQILDRIILYLIKIEEHEKVGPDSKVTSGEHFLQREKIPVQSSGVTENVIV